MGERYERYGRPDEDARRYDARRESHRRDDPMRDDRGFVDRATDEVRSWFGDDDAAARRQRDDPDERRYGWGRDDRERWRSREPRRESREGSPDYRGGYEAGYGRTPRGASAAADRDRDWREPFFEDAEERRSVWEGRRRGRTTPETFGPGLGMAAAGATEGVDRQGHWATDYRGRGPKGYQRSDDRIREDICDRLTWDSWVDASEITVAVQGGEVSMSGSVPSRDQKRRAEDLVESIPGVRDVNNQLRVGRVASAGEPGERSARQAGGETSGAAGETPPTVLGLSDTRNTRT